MSERDDLTSWSDDLLGGLQLREYLDLLRRRKLWVILTTTAIFVCAVVVVLRLPDTYRSETVILVDPQKVPDSYVPSTVTTSISDRLSTIRQQVMSPTRLKRLIDTLGLYSNLRGRKSEQEIIQVMQKSTAIEVVDPGGQRLSAFRIAFQGSNPVQVAQVADQIAAMFIEENLRVRQQQFFGTAEFLDRELQDIKRQLDEKEKGIQEIKSRYILDLPESKQYHLEALNSLRSQLHASEDRVNRAQQSIMYLRTVEGSGPAPTIDLDAGAEGMAISPFQAQIQKEESRLAELKGRYGPNHPDVRKAHSQLDQLKAKATAEAQSMPVPKEPVKVARRPVRNPVVEAELNRLTKEIEEQNKLQSEWTQQINFHISKLEKVPVFEQQISGLMREYDSLKTHYAHLLDKKLSADEASALESRQKAERFVILDPAAAPEKPYGPNRFLLSLAGFLGGLMSGIGLAFLRETTDECVRSEREAARILGKPVLAGIPWMVTKKERRWNRMRVVGAVAGTAAASVVIGVLISRFAFSLF